jgi:hypothetical protein
VYKLDAADETSVTKIRSNDKVTLETSISQSTVIHCFDEVVVAVAESYQKKKQPASYHVGILGEPLWAGSSEQSHLLWL